MISINIGRHPGRPGTVKSKQLLQPGNSPKNSGNNPFRTDVSFQNMQTMHFGSDKSIIPGNRHPDSAPNPIIKEYYGGRQIQGEGVRGAILEEGIGHSNALSPNSHAGMIIRHIAACVPRLQGIGSLDKPDKTLNLRYSIQFAPKNNEPVKTDEEFEARFFQEVWFFLDSVNDCLTKISELPKAKRPHVINMSCATSVVGALVRALDSNSRNFGEPDILPDEPPPKPGSYLEESMEYTRKMKDILEQNPLILQLLHSSESSSKTLLDDPDFRKKHPDLDGPRQDVLMNILRIDFHDPKVQQWAAGLEPNEQRLWQKMEALMQEPDPEKRLEHLLEWLTELRIADSRELERQAPPKLHQVIVAFKCWDPEAPEAQEKTSQLPPPEREILEEIKPWTHQELSDELRLQISNWLKQLNTDPVKQNTFNHLFREVLIPSIHFDTLNPEDQKRLQAVFRHSLPLSNKMLESPDKSRQLVRKKPKSRFEQLFPSTINAILNEKGRIPLPQQVNALCREYLENEKLDVEGIRLLDHSHRVLRGTHPDYGTRLQELQQKYQEITKTLYDQGVFIVVAAGNGRERMAESRARRLKSEDEISDILTFPTMSRYVYPIAAYSWQVPGGNNSVYPASLVPNLRASYRIQEDSSPGNNIFVASPVDEDAFLDTGAARTSYATATMFITIVQMIEANGGHLSHERFKEAVRATAEANRKYADPEQNYTDKDYGYGFLIPHQIVQWILDHPEKPPSSGKKPNRKKPGWVA